MKLMPLTPESKRLRRIAKAHAAGEFSREEYRQARRTLISGYAQAGIAALEDTFRRSADTARRVAGESLMVADSATMVRRPPGFGWLILTTGLLVALLWSVPGLW